MNAAEKAGSKKKETVVEWIIVAFRAVDDQIVWGPFDSEEDAVSFIHQEGHLPEIVARWEEPFPKGMSVFPFPMYDPDMHLQFRREMEE